MQATDLFYRQTFFYGTSNIFLHPSLDSFSQFIIVHRIDSRDKRSS